MGIYREFSSFELGMYFTIDLFWGADKMYKEWKQTDSASEVFYLVYLISKNVCWWISPTGFMKW